MMKHLALLLIVVACSAALSLGSDTFNSTLDSVGPHIWNARGNFYIDDLINIGVHMTVIQLENGNFLVFDTIELQPFLKEQLDLLTKNGSLIEAVISTHPFHTTYFPAFFAAYPNPPYYGTPRIIKMEPNISWVGTVTDPAVQTKWSEVQMSIPAGAEFIDPQPPSYNHFAGMFVFHNESQTIHIDDTLMVVPANASWLYNHTFFESGPIQFHPSLKIGGICKIQTAPDDFKNFMNGLIDNWDFDNVLAAHIGRFMGGAKQQVVDLMNRTEETFEELTKEYSGKTGVCQ